MVTTTRTFTELAEISARLIVDAQQDSGAYPASPDFSAYRGYCWFRDGSFIADGISAAGNETSASAFFTWAASTIDAHAEHMQAAVDGARVGAPLPDAQMLPTRFTFDGKLGSDPWWDFQLDGYGTWLWALAAHVRRHELDPTPWLPAVHRTVEYLVSSWQRPCYDWWEEHAEHVHVSTLGCIGAGLEAIDAIGVLDAADHRAAQRVAHQIRTLVAERGTVDGHLVKWLGDSAVDGSLSALIAPLAWLSPDDPVAIGTIRAVDTELTVDGGVHRFAADTFYGGGQWPLLTCFLGLAKAATGDLAGAQQALGWAAAQAGSDGMLPEQVPDHLLAPHRRQEWIERWGTVATPLLWSHGQYLRLWHALDRP